MCKDKDTLCRIIDVFSPDTDALVLLIGNRSKISPRLNMVLSSTNTIDIKYVAGMLGEDKYNALIGLYALTGLRHHRYNV